jgi:hypothetical protein
MGQRRRTAPRRTLIAPLVMLASGAVVGVMLWRFLMLDPAPETTRRPVGPEQLSPHDQQALDHVLSGRRAP